MEQRSQEKSEKKKHLHPCRREKRRSYRNGTTFERGKKGDRPKEGTTRMTEKQRPQGKKQPHRGDTTARMTRFATKKMGNERTRKSPVKTGESPDL